MSTISYNGGYLHCNVFMKYSVEDAADRYESAEKMCDDYKQDIIDDCIKRGYTESEIEAVLYHYKIKIHNCASFRNRL